MFNPLVLDVQNHATANFPPAGASVAYPPALDTSDLWGSTGYLANLYGSTVSEGEFEAAAVWPHIAHYLLDDAAIGYSSGLPDFLHGRVPVETHTTLREAMHRGRFTIACVHQHELDELVTHLDRYAGAVVVRCTTTDDLARLARHYENYVQVSLGTNCTYVLVHQRRDRALASVAVPEFVTSPAGSECSNIFACIEHIEQSRAGEKVVKATLV